MLDTNLYLGSNSTPPEKPVQQGSEEILGLTLGFALPGTQHRSA
jgi:hypothetical protein